MNRRATIIVAMFTRNRLLPVAGLLLALLVAACGGGDSGNSDSNTIVIGDDPEFTTVIATSEQVVGPNRFVIGILDGNNVPVVGAKVHLTFFDISGQAAVKKSEGDAASVVPARDAGLTEQVTHMHSDGTRHVHTNAGDDVGVYVANVDFDRAGNWGVEVAVDSAKPKIKGSQRVSFNVIETSVTPAVGSPAPRSRNLTLADVGDITEIDSSAEPVPAFHQTTIADAIAAAKATLVLFAVPGFCESRFCGPEYEIMKKLHSRYEGRAEFIHVEFYKNPGSPERVLADAAREWGLRSEPWFFVVDSKGVITAKFEGPTSLAELEEALRKVVQGT